MRLKKLMSLVLVCAMVLSLTVVASAADTRVYFAEDFSKYVDTEDKTAIQNFTSTFSEYPNKNQNPSPAAVPLEGVTNVYGVNTSNSGPAAGYKAFVTNDFGSKAFQTWGDGIIGTANESLLAINRSFNYDFYPDTPWNPNEKQDETLVISYEYEAHVQPGLAELTAYAGTSSAWFTDSTKTATSSFSIAREKHAAGTKAVGVEGEEGYVPATAPAKYNVNFPDGQGGASAVGATQLFDNDTTIRIAYGFSYDSATNLNRYYAINGGSVATSNVARLPFNAGNTTFYAFRHGQWGSTRSTIANIKIYTMKTNDFKVTVDQVKDVALTTKSMRVYFSNIVAPATYAAPVVKADGVALEAGTYSVSALKNVVGNVGGEVYSYVDVTFESLEEGTVYTVEFPETITNEIGTTLGTKNVAEFSTKLPDVKFNNITVVGAANLVADGSLQAVKLDLKNTTAEDKAISIIYAVYAANGKLESVSYVNDTIAASKTAEIETGLKLATEGKLKTYLWESMVAFKPYTAEKTLTIAAPAVAE